MRAPGGAASQSSSTRPRRPATAWPRNADARRPSDRAAISLCAQQISGRAGGVSLAQGLQAAGQFDPHLQRLRHALAHLRRLWRGVRRVPAPKARRQAVHGRRRRHADARLSLRHRRRRCVFARRGHRTDGEVWNLGAGNPQPVNRLVELLGGPVVHIPKRPGEPDCTWADIGKITRELGWKQNVSFDQGVAKILANIEYWRDAPLWDPNSIANATKCGLPLWPRSPEHDGPSQQQDRQPQGQDCSRKSPRRSARVRARKK